MKALVTKLFAHFDQRLAEEAQKYRDEGLLPTVEKMTCRVVGQVALLIANLPFDVSATTDIDVIFTPRHVQTSFLEQIALKYGFVLETDHHLIEMPKQTKYHLLYSGAHVSAYYADAFYVMASKCQFKRDKDKRLIQQYLDHFPASDDKIKKMGIATSWLK